jgi:tol-pal system protein YbgF
MMSMRVALLAAALLLPFGALPAAAQDLDPVRVEKRVGRLESEMRAVQRKVFPGSDGRYFEPEITAPVAAAPESIGNQANAPLIDLSQRVGALEQQLRTMTGQVEASQYKLRLLEEAQAKLSGDVEFRLNALEGNGPAAAPGARDQAAGAGAPELPPFSSPRASSPAKAEAPPKPAASPEAAWKPAYAKALAKDWPSTETAMTDFIAAYPKATRLPQAQYWLGRSHAERKQHAEAARSFLELYKTAPASDRAPDALLGLATALDGLKKPKDACRVLGELDSVYGAKLVARQKADAKALGTKAKCAA